MSDTLDDPAIRKRLEELGLEIVPPERRTPRISRQVPAAGDRALGEADPRGRHQRGLSGLRDCRQPKSALADFGQHKRPNSGKPEFGCVSGDHNHRLWNMGPRVRGDDSRRQCETCKKPAGGRHGEDDRRDAIAFLLVASGAAQAQDWPARPVNMIVPYAAGGPVDTIARILAARLSEVLGQQVVVENVGGAGGMTGASRVAKAPPDGYTVLLSGSAVLAINQTLYKKPLYNAVTDFEHVALFADSARVLITRKDFPANTLPEFVAYAKANQAKMQYGSAGAGSGIACLRHPARRGHGHQDHARALSRLRPGDAGSDRRPHRLHRRADFDRAAADPRQHREGDRHARARPRARPRGSPDRAGARPRGARLRQLGLRSRFRRERRTAIVQRLAKASNEAVETPAVRERYKSIGVTIPAPERRTPEYLAKFVPSEIERWAGPIKASGASAD